MWRAALGLVASGSSRAAPPASSTCGSRLALAAVGLAVTLTACAPPWGYPEWPHEAEQRRAERADEARERRERERAAPHVPPPPGPVEPSEPTEPVEPDEPDGARALAMARLTYPQCRSPRFVEWLDWRTAALDVCGVRRVYRWGARGRHHAPVETLETSQIEQPITDETDPMLVALVEELAREHPCPRARVHVHGPVVEGRHLRVEVCDTWYHFQRRPAGYVRVAPGE